MIMKTWWIVIEKQYETDEMYGPYPDQHTAYHAMCYSSAIEHSCQEDCLECYLEENDWIPEENRFKRQWKATWLRSIFRQREVMVVDLNDPYNTGQDVQIIPVTI